MFSYNKQQYVCVLSIDFKATLSGPDLTFLVHMWPIFDSFYDSEQHKSDFFKSGPIHFHMWSKSDLYLIFFKATSGCLSSFYITIRTGRRKLKCKQWTKQVFPPSLNFNTDFTHESRSHLDYNVNNQQISAKKSELCIKTCSMKCYCNSTFGEGDCK